MMLIKEKFRRSKYRNVKVDLDGHKFDSKKEANRYAELKMLMRAREVTDLEVHPRYDLIINGTKICSYIPDFRYKRAGALVIEDVKGVRTKEYLLKKKLMKALHNVEVVET